MGNLVDAAGTRHGQAAVFPPCSDLRTTQHPAP